MDRPAEDKVSNNHYESLYIDVTNRCNMCCSFCYSSKDRSAWDMPLDYFTKVCRYLPQPINMRFVGGEPTLHPDFFKLVSVAREHGHHVHCSSNGLNYNNDHFMEKLAQVNGSFGVGLTMDGGTSNRQAYMDLNGEDYLDEKLNAFKNLCQKNIRRVSLTAMVARGVNENVIADLLQLALSQPQTVRYVHFRTAAQIGRWLDIEPYSLDELKALVEPHFTAKQMKPACINEIHCLPEENRHCCYRFRPTKRLQISLIEFASERSANCPKRGRLLDDFRIAPFFRHVIDSGR